ncbi:MAG: PAS domain-containing sensor histidine kinase [Arthrospira sp. PLM2.Bin9]|nr:PAS domain-containing protein [Arthrospira sp. PLM2.Bin9]TVU55629.1 MAG: PAS domain-containing sensor histidine kinase [Arthrospira sp. PLM2.Bin9]
MQLTGVSRIVNNQSTQSFSSQEAASVSNGYNCSYNSMYSAAVPGRSGDILFNQLMASMPTAIAMVDRQMRYVAISQPWQDHYSDSQISENLLGVCHDQLFPNLPDRWHENAEASLAGTLDIWELETCLSLSDGSIEWVKWVVKPWKTETGAIAGLILSLEAITESKQLKDTLQLTQLAMDRAADAVLWITLDGRLCYVNDTACRLLGYSRAELLKLKIYDIDPDLSPTIWSVQCEDIRHKGSLTFESRHSCRHGIICPVEVNVNYLEVKPSDINIKVNTAIQTGDRHSPTLPLLCWFARDISERQAASSVITESRDQLEAVLNAVPGLVSWVSSDLRYLGVNQHLANAYGVPTHQFIGKEVGFLQTSPEFNQFVYAFFDSNNWTSSREITANVKGEPRTYLIVAQKYHRGAAAVFVGLDITERRNMEMALRLSEEQETRRRSELEAALVQLQRTQTQLVQTEKMSSLGQLVAGIAHEINNPVNFIFGNLGHGYKYIEDLLRLVDLYKQYYPETPPEIEEEMEEIGYDFIKIDLPKMFESMQVGAERIRDVVRSLRVFTRLDEAQMKAANIHEGLDSTLLILQNRLQAKGGRGSIKLVKTYGDLPLIECYPGQLNQVFMNLITYHIDRLEMAMVGSDRIAHPTLSVTTTMMESKDKKGVMISIADNSPSLSPEDVQQVFEPLLATPTCGQRTALGLSIAHHLVVEKHGGELACVSPPQGGLEFRIYIPLKCN